MKNIQKCKKHLYFLSPNNSFITSDSIMKGEEEKGKRKRKEKEKKKEVKKKEWQCMVSKGRACKRSVPVSSCWAEIIIAVIISSGCVIKSILIIPHDHDLMMLKF